MKRYVLLAAALAALVVVLIGTNRVTVQRPGFAGGKPLVAFAIAVPMGAVAVFLVNAVMIRRASDRANSA